MARAVRPWWVKATVQGALARTPGAARWSDAWRSRGGIYLEPAYALTKWPHAKRHLRAMGSRAGRAVTGQRVLEIGTGWFPVVPVGLGLHGADVLTVDTTAHLDPTALALTVQVLAGLVDDGRIRVPDGPRLSALRDLAGSDRLEPAELEALGVRSAIADATDLSGLPEASGSTMLVSNNTLEHIPADVLGGIFAEFARVAAPTARMSHYIDLADHYAAGDPRIGEFHFLTLSPAAWRLANNRLGYQNRLRLPDYVRLLEQNGWAVDRMRNTSREAAELDGLALRPPFDTMPADDVLVVKSHLVAARA